MLWHSIVVCLRPLLGICDDYFLSRFINALVAGDGTLGLLTWLKQVVGTFLEILFVGNSTG